MFNSPSTENKDIQGQALSFEDKALDIEKEENSLLKDLISKQKKQLVYSRISGIAVLAMALVILVTCLKLVPEVMFTLKNVNSLLAEAEDTIEEVNTTLASLDTTFDSINSMSGEITTAAEGINSLVDDNAEVLTDAMARLNGIDFDGLNSAISDLQAVIEPMARFMSNFR